MQVTASIPLQCDGDIHMSHAEKQLGKELPLVSPLSVRVLPNEVRTVRRQPRKIIEAHLDRLLALLALPGTAIDTSLVRETLLDLSADIRYGSSSFHSNDYRWILTHLTRTYARGLDRRTQDPFTATAAAYAQVIETLSHLFPGQDYSEAVGQLFCYMSRLFRAQEHSWKAVYKHILSIPESVEAKRLLNRAYFVEIQEWAEAGVDNLFSIRNNLCEKIAALAARIDRLERRIAKIADASTRPVRAGTAVNGSNVIDFAEARRKRLIRLLEHRRAELTEEKNGEESVLGFIESDIREFENKLRNTRRAYFVHTV